MNGSDVASSLEELSRGIRVCRKCPLHASRMLAVPGEGKPRARVMFIGEAPGEEEDRQGRPFVGRAGRFLDVLLEMIGLERPDVFIASSVKCHPPGNRVPRLTELETCKAAWLDRQLELVDPGIIVLMGSTPLRQVLGCNERLRDVHGVVRTHGGRSYLITYHPAVGIRFPDASAAIRHDFRRLKRLLSGRRWRRGTLPGRKTRS